ncbi:MAG: hypothetical protein MUC48_03675 [Leptolyngbya sp. Prado105]|jgi:hypothetical protein|nr:hypothetical protein [Leptolyngbya sp. Prado105]
MIPKLHLLNWGMGVESTAILVRWILEPNTRPFSTFQDLIVLTAQTGDEISETKILCEAYLFPLLRQHRIRLVQVAKTTASKLDGYVVLSDTTEPIELFTEGYFKLSQDLAQSGTVPRLGRPHTCAQRWKGEVLDAWITDHVDEAFGPYLGYNADELKRAGKADGYTCQGHQFIYPLIEWGWTRNDCIDYLYCVFGVLWRKSACAYCPFQQKNAAIERYHRDPKAGGYALLLESNALAFNPRMHLFSSGTAYDLIVESGNLAAIAELNRLLDQTQWAVYHVQRIYKQLIGKNGKPYVNADRKVTIVAQGQKAEMESNLQAIAQEQNATIKDLYGRRFYLHHRLEGLYPAIEEFYVVAPNLAKDKCRSLKAFDQQWAELTNQTEAIQLSLF